VIRHLIRLGLVYEKILDEQSQQMMSTVDTVTDLKGKEESATTAESQ